jgi:hypothetical protein
VGLFSGIASIFGGGGGSSTSTSSTSNNVTVNPTTNIDLDFDLDELAQALKDNNLDNAKIEIIKLQQQKAQFVAEQQGQNALLQQVAQFNKIIPFALVVGASVYLYKKGKI